MAGTITESRLKEGTLTLGTSPGESFACQATNVRLTPSTNIETPNDESIETLCGATTSPDAANETVTTTWVLAIDAIQDFNDESGFVQYCFDNGGQLVDFSWKPNVTAPTYSGQCRIVPVEIGGDVAARLTTSAEFPVAGTPTVTPHTP